MMIDIDGFKSVNDRYGHLAGDAILSAIGAQLAVALRNSDVTCRYGGDEFLIILPDTNLAGAERAAAVVVEQIGRISVDAHGAVVRPTVSVGVTSALDGEHELATVIARADQALYEAKRAGRNRAVASRLASAS